MHIHPRMCVCTRVCGVCTCACVRACAYYPSFASEIPRLLWLLLHMSCPRSQACAVVFRGLPQSIASRALRAE
eukprot:m.582605 g.582605  ORF g.582605 m.582605 type:complete len:73 (+) comp22337_c1_seq20:635-853(+)